MDITANLVEKAKNGDSNAWSELYSATFPVAFGVAMQLVKNKDTAEDIIQDSYITAFTKLDTLKEQDKFQHWFNRIVANNCKNYLVKKKPELFSQHATYTEDGEELDFDVVDDRTEYQPDNAVITDEIKQLFYDMVANLPEEQRTCALMFWVQELTIPEIAEILGVSQNTVKSRIHYAKKKMTAEADEMRKKGISVFSFSGFALIPFLRWLFRSGLGITASPEKAEGILKICKSAGSMTKATGTAKAVAETVKTTAKVGGTIKTVSTVGAGAITKGIATKIIAGVLAAAIGVGGITLAVKKSNSNNVEDQTTEQVVESTEEMPTKDEIIIAESVSDLGLNEELLKSAIAIVTADMIVVYDPFAIDYGKGETVNWMYYHIMMNNIYNGTDLKRDEEYQQKVKNDESQYHSYVSTEQFCGIPDYESFGKLYYCLYGERDFDNEYNKFKEKMYNEPYPYPEGTLPYDYELENAELSYLGEGEYQISYTVNSWWGFYDTPMENRNDQYITHHIYHIKKKTITFKVDENSVLGFVISDHSSEEIGTCEETEVFDGECPEVLYY